VSYLFFVLRLIYSALAVELLALSVERESHVNVREQSHEQDDCDRD
jgi:hypothetical protein